MDQFELKKRDFSMKTPSRRPSRLSLPMRSLVVTTEMNKYYDTNLSDVLLTQEDMKSLFDPAVEVILKLVGDQVAQVKANNETQIKTMVLVGGFGSSPYITERLSEWCAEQVIRLTTPWSGSYVYIPPPSLSGHFTSATNH
jgi:hypothetical protein